MSAQPKSALDIARALIAFPSVTPADAGALPYLEGLLEDAGFSAEIVSFAAPGTPSIDNLYARFGVEAPNFVFAGHTDVVPPGDAEKWRFDPFAGALADGQIWGRGACDMKGGLAAVLAAALRFVARGPFRGSISFLVTGDEEGPAVNGTVKLLDWARERGERFDHCLLGEPTSVAALGDTIKNGRRGSLTGRLVVSGKQGHVAYPRLADNPIRPLAPILDRPADAAPRSRHAGLRGLQPRSRQRRRRQSRDQRHSRRGSPGLQHPLQRSVDAGVAERRNRAARRGGGGRRARRA